MPKRESFLTKDGKPNRTIMRKWCKRWNVRFHDDSDNGFVTLSGNIRSDRWFTLRNVILSGNGRWIVDNESCFVFGAYDSFGDAFRHALRSCSKTRESFCVRRGIKG